jgi:polysaccharide export outer membrane protein
MTSGRVTMAGTLWRCVACRFHRGLRAAALLSGLAFSSAVLADAPGDSRDYKLAPGDRITVSVVGQAELSSDMILDGAGNIILPLIGAIEVRDLTIVECERVIHDRLADGILNQPSVIVRIGELRPLYVLGDVRTSGVYPFRYGSTVKSAVAAAGGFGLPEPMQNASASEFLLAEERVRQLSFQKRALLVRRARLEAQRDGKSTFSPPALTGSTQENEIAETVAIEKETLDSQAGILQKQLELLRAQKPRIQNEIASLNAQTATTKKQLELVKQHADQYSGLVKQGLGLANSELQLRLAEATQESELWRLAAQISRLQMDSGALDLQIHEAEAIFKRQIITELRDVGERLKELDVVLPVAREIREVRLAQAGSLAGAETARSISVTRTRNGEVTSFQATETTPLEPGDVIDVKRSLPRVLRYQGASARQPSLQDYQMGAAAPARSAGLASP